MSVSLLGLLSSPAAIANEDLSTPIAVKPTSYIWKDYHQQLAAWRRRIYLDSFHSRARTGKPWDDAAEDFIRQTLAFWIGDEDEEEPSEEDKKARLSELAQNGRKLLAQGCDDPVVGYFEALHEGQQSRDWRAAVPKYEKAIKALEKTPGTYPRAVALRVGMSLRAVYVESGDKNGDSKRLQALDDKMLGWLWQSLGDGSFAKDEDFLLVQLLVGPHAWHSFFASESEQIAAGLPGAPLPEWVRQTLLGKIEVHRAWHIRGGGWAYEVDPGAWPGFAQHLELARQALTQGWKLRPDRPEAAEEMESVVMAGGGAPGDTLRLWFDRATAAQFDYSPAYQAMLWALRPRWCGSHEEMLAFGRLCLGTKRFDTGVPGDYLAAVEQVASELPDWREVYRRPDVAVDVMEVDRGNLEAPSRRAEQPLWLSYLAVDAWMCGRDEDAAKALATLAGEGGFRGTVAVEKLKRFDIDQPAFLSEVALLTGVAREDYIQARTLDQASKVEDAIAAYQAVLKKVAPAEPASYLLHRRLYALGIEQELAGGDWVKIDPANELPNWHRVSGTWLVADGALENQGTNSPALLILPTRIGPNFELRGSFESDSGQLGTLGIVFGYDEQKRNGGKWKTCQAWQDGQQWRASVLQHFSTTKDAPKGTVRFERTNHFLVQCWQGKLWFYLNGELMAENFEHHHDEAVTPANDGPEVGFGSFYTTQGNTTKITAIEVRRLMAAPLPLSSVSAASSSAGSSPSAMPGETSAPAEPKPLPHELPGLGGAE